MTSVVIIGIAVLLLLGLLFFEKKDSIRGKLFTKPFLSLLFIITAVVQQHPNPTYYYLLLIGLAFCLGGDVCLAIPGQKTFRVGLIFFLLGHLFYAVSFFTISGLTFIGISVAGILLVAAVVVYLWLRSHLGPMKIPVIAYIVIISVMLCGASSVLGDPEQTESGRAIVFFGALLFYISDLFVARQRFIRQRFINRLTGLPLYYTGQFLIAMSTGFVQ